MIVRYQVDGKRYFYQVAFEQYQGTNKVRREAKSLLPPPPELNESPEVLQEDAEPIPNNYDEPLVNYDEPLVIPATDKIKSKIREDKIRQELAADDSPGKLPDIGAIYQLFDKLDPRRQVTPLQAEDLKGLFDEFGGERLEYAIRQAAEHSAPTLAYIKGILKGNGKPPGHRQSTGVNSSVNTRWG
jgi:DnaD/phage-associated family protein